MPRYALAGQAASDAVTSRIAKAAHSTGPALMVSPTLFMYAASSCAVLASKHMLYCYI